MSREDRNKETKIELNSGLIIRIPNRQINRMVLPSVTVNREFKRLVLTSQDFLQILKPIKKAEQL